ncbi:transaldolase [Polaromonas sp. JS666]|uniref:transaldolase n=1 Tax=Polaromonas sp. (strain JS666 / ATCC BAA-500) TaxID=296591 RepID=UPI0000535BD5|nr:transaldolase [Polaromonas sp. JS666]ABE46239.1 transaldolase [Polaromonas sp. JS666]
MNQLESLRQFTTVVVDTGDFNEISRFRPTDATTNPSLILKAVQQQEYRSLLDSTVSAEKKQPLDLVMDQLLVRFGCEILKLVPGRVSTEIDPRLSFDANATVARAERIIALYEANGIAPERVLIKIASTWEGIQAAAQLESRGIHTNLTLLFSLTQAVACSQAKVKLISPFVGRIYDWHRKQAGAAWNEGEGLGVTDPGVQVVRQIFHYYKKFAIPTEVMGASFRNLHQIRSLAGCDLLTISPQLLAQLESHDEPCSIHLAASDADDVALAPLACDEASFRFAMNEDAMVTEKLAEGIRLFCRDLQALEQIIAGTTSVPA